MYCLPLIVPVIGTEVVSIKAHLRPHGDGKGGTYFGATGCGKTYTMLFLSRMLMLRDSETFNNPTIVIITDRDEQCTAEGSSEVQVEASKKAMTRMRHLLGNPERIHRLAKDIVQHYEALCTEKPLIVQKAMIVCSDRTLAYAVWKEIVAMRPEWNQPKRCENEDGLERHELHKLIPLEKIKIVATRDKDDEPELFHMLGTNEFRKKLDIQFKNTRSNFQVAIVVDMWITGFDVPSLAVMYVDKPIQKHTLIQTISRVNRVYAGKSQGLVVDYIGIKDDMMKALKKYGGEGPIDNLAETLAIFRNQLSLLDKITIGFDATQFYSGEPLDRLLCLNRAAEYIQISKEMQIRFMDISRKMKAAYEICMPSGELTHSEVDRAQFYLAVRSIVYKQTKGHAPDILKTKYIGVSMSELVTLCNSLNGDTAVIYLTDKQSRQLCEMTDAGFIMDCGLHINKSQLQAIIDNVKNHLLEWTLELEEKGVLGEGLCFSKSETTAAQTVSSSTNYFFGSVVQGNVTNSQISTGNKNELTYNADKAKDATNAIRKQVELEDISNVDKSDIYEMIDDINDKIDQKKRSGVIRSMIVGLKDFCIQAGANITAALVVEQLFQLF